MNDRVLIDYTNHRGIRGERLIVPKGLYFGSSMYHEAAGRDWFLHAWDHEKEANRTFRMADVHSWTPAPDPLDAEK